MGNCYSHLSSMEREEISRAVALGCGVRLIAWQLGRSASTVSRELRRNAERRTTGRRPRSGVRNGERALPVGHANCSPIRGCIAMLAGGSSTVGRHSKLRRDCGAITLRTWQSESPTRPSMRRFTSFRAARCAVH